jgi:hypothetical protein
LNLPEASEVVEADAGAGPSNLISLTWAFARGALVLALRTIPSTEHWSSGFAPASGEGEGAPGGSGSSCAASNEKPNNQTPILI